MEIILYIQKWNINFTTLLTEYCLEQGCQTGSLWARCITPWPHPPQLHEGKNVTIHHVTATWCHEFDTHGIKQSKGENTQSISSYFWFSFKLTIIEECWNTYICCIRARIHLVQHFLFHSMKPLLWRKAKKNWMKNAISLDDLFRSRAYRKCFPSVVHALCVEKELNTEFPVLEQTALSHFPCMAGISISTP